jgi:NAD(P)-dependent dehydrogenase (short-subunit alcohol dehydrogenase family)
MTISTTVLITGANKGLGAETSRRLADLGWTVWMGARNIESSEVVARQIRGRQPDADVRPVAVDVTSDESVAAAREVVSGSGTGLDVLVNNAGVTGSAFDTLTTKASDFADVFDVNVLGPVRMTGAFASLLRQSQRPRLVMVSSGLGTIEFVDDPQRPEHGVPGMVYQSSKSALDMIAARYARALPEVRVCVVDPGYTATDLNAHSGYQSVTEGTDAIVAAVSADDVPARKFDRHDLDRLVAFAAARSTVRE